jgi:hypothetical protein
LYFDFHTKYLSTITVTITETLRKQKISHMYGQRVAFWNCNSASKNKCFVKVKMIALDRFNGPLKHPIYKLNYLVQVLSNDY